MEKKRTLKQKVCATMLVAALMGQTLPVPAAFAAESATSANGQLDLSIKMELPTPNKTFKVALNGSSVSEKTNEKDTQMSFNQALSPGKYTLTVSAPGYLTYTQEVVIKDGMTTKLSLHNSREVNPEGEKPLYGVMAVGDVNNDGKIDTADSDAMMDAIDGGSKDATYDLNGDDEVNVADLAYITVNYGGNNTATPLEAVSADRLTPTVNDGEIKAGNPEDLISGSDSFVQLAAKGDAAISEDNPVEVSLDVASDMSETVVDGLVIAPPEGSGNLITDATISVEDMQGNKYQPISLSKAHAAKATRATATQEKDGTIVVNLGEQIAVKKVTIKVTGASTNLVDIAQVEFVNGMENRIPEPEMNVPTIQELKQLSAGNNPSFSVTWNKENNITGYEVSVRSKDTEAFFETKDTTLTVTTLGKGKLKTYEPYTVRVRSTNGEWKSPYSEEKNITLKPESAPPRPEGVSVTGAVEAITVSWKAMRDTQSYSVYYRAQGETDFKVVDKIKGTSHTLANLKPTTTYEVYVVGHNELGKSPDSELKKATTLTASNLKMPNYKRINTTNGVGKPTAHIEGVELKNYQADDPMVIVDDSIESYATANSWDTGGFNSGKGGPIITLDQEYEMDTIRFSGAAGRKDGYYYVRLYTWDDEGKETLAVSTNEKKGKIYTKKDENGNVYQEIKFDKPLKVKRFQLCLANYSASGNQTLSEIAAYHYDSLASDIEDIFTDETHISFKEGIGRTEVDALQKRLDTPDAISGEYHPDRATLALILEDAYALLENQLDKTVISVNNNLTEMGDRHLDFAYTMSDLQPLGRTVQAGETVNVYVGAKDMTQGAATNLKVVFTQNAGESSKWQQSMPLTVGQNSFTVPDISGRAAESGGAMYVCYTGSSGKDQYSVRVSGGTKIPMLNVAGKDGEARESDIASYVEDLKEYVGDLESRHNDAGNVENTVHTGKYSPEKCVLNVTDIVMNGMMYSVPASKVWEAIKDKPEEKIADALAAMEQELELLYQHRGLHKNGTGKDRYPFQQLNIRYQTMFDGAFMYAGGKHIGIGFNSTNGLFGITPVKTDEQGNKISGQMTGWGIAHEIGHVINSKHYATAEVTNNYYAILSTGNTRSDYEDVHRAVTSDGTNNGSTALAMYWQLHMAFDPYGNYKIFDTPEEMKNNLFFARMDSYARNPGSAPNGLSLSGTKSDILIRLACAAAGKNLLPFFDAWGMSYDETTQSYASDFPSEERSVQYMTPDAQAYRLGGGKGMDTATKVEASLEYKVTGKDSNKVTLKFSNNGDKDAMLGYEIIRNGEAVAFVSADQNEYVDTITTGNNRVYEYEIIAHDKLLQKTEPVKLDPVKVTHDGTLGREKWTATTNMISEADEKIEADENNGYCEDTTVSAINRVIDGKGETYTGKVTAKYPEIVLKLGETNQVTALRYEGETTALTISVSTDGKNWQKVRTLSAEALEQDSNNLIVHEDGSKTIYFENPSEANNLYVCDAAYVKVEMPAVRANTPISLQNIELLGPVGDNVEWLGNQSIGRLKADYTYAEGQVIPKDSIVFMGTYKGNPAYNVVLLKDKKGQIVGGIDESGAIKAQQIILAPSPEGGNLGDIAEGTWIYWIEPQDVSKGNLPNDVMVEMYRVDDAMTMAGQRLVSETLYQKVPALDEMPDIEINAKAKDGTAIKSVQPKVKVDVQKKNATVETVVAQANLDEQVAKPATVTNQSAVQVASTGVEAQADGVKEVVSVTAQAKAKETPEFSIIPVDNDKKKAQLAMDLGDENAPTTVALQAAIEVEDGATKATLNWNKALDRASFKEYRFDAEKDRLTIYITAREDLFNDGTLTLGTLSMDSVQGTKSVSLNLQKDFTRVVNSAYEVDSLQGLQSQPMELVTTEASGGSVGNISYSIDVESSDGGTINVQPKRAEKGELVTVNVVANEGYVLDRLTVTTVNGKTISLETVSDQQYTFEMPGAKVLVKAVFKLQGDQPEQNNPFTDIAPTDYYYDSVLWAVDKNLVAGVAENLFAPHMDCTRAQMVVFLWRTHGCPQVDGELPFVDVPEDAYYADAVRWAVAEGVTGGTTATTFSPDMTLTRAQTVVFLHREAGSPTVEAEGFSDVSADAYYADAVAWAVAEGVTSGTGENLFSPNLACTRAQIVCFLHKAEMAKERVAQ